MGLQLDEPLIVLRLGALNLVQAMYDCLSPTIIREKLNPIFSPKAPKGNELNQAVMRCAHAVKSESVI